MTGILDITFDLLSPLDKLSDSPALCDLVQHMQHDTPPCALVRLRLVLHFSQNTGQTFANGELPFCIF
jgi:hypothetical protein